MKSSLVPASSRSWLEYNSFYIGYQRLLLDHRKWSSEGSALLQCPSLGDSWPAATIVETMKYSYLMTIPDFIFMLQLLPGLRKILLNFDSNSFFLLISIPYFPWPETATSGPTYRFTSKSHRWTTIDMIWECERWVYGYLEAVRTLG